MAEILLILASVELAVLVLGGGHCLRRNRRVPAASSNSRPLSASVIVPVAGADPGLEHQLASLAKQEDVEYEVILVTGSQTDPAVPVIERFLQGLDGPARSRFGRRVAGAATQCSQKNHNVLNGVGAARPASDALVFCDTCHDIPADWLKTLLAPIAAGEVEVSSAYHFIVPRDGRAFTAAHAVIVMGLHLVQNLPASGQPWGGSMAIRRTAFETLDVATLWATNIVDDVSLARRLRSRRMPFRVVTSACLETPLAGERVRDAWNWVSRQMLYEKHVSPEVWLCTGLALLLPNAALAAACVAPAIGIPFLLYIATLASVLRLSHPKPGPWLPWVAGSFMAIVFAGACHAATWFMSTVTWRGTRYRVGRGGRVRLVEPASGGAV